MVKVAIKNWQSNLIKEGVILMALLRLGPVHDAPMARNDVSKVLDLKSSFKSRGKEAPKRTDD